MTQSDLQLFVALTEAVVRTMTFQNATTRMMIAELEQLKTAGQLRRQLDALPASAKRTALRAQLDRLEFEFDSQIHFEALKPALQQSARDQEKIHELLALLKGVPSTGASPGYSKPPEFPTAQAPSA